MNYTPEDEDMYPKYEVNNRVMRDYQDANLYWQIHGGTLMEKLDHMTPWHVLQIKPTKGQEK